MSYRTRCFFDYQGSRKERLISFFKSLSPRLISGYSFVIASFEELSVEWLRKPCSFFFLTFIVSLSFSILFLTCSAVDFFLSKVNIIFNAKLDAKKRRNFPLGTCFLYKILAPPRIVRERKIFPPGQCVQLRGCFIRDL